MSGRYRPIKIVCTDRQHRVPCDPASRKPACAPMARHKSQLLVTIWGEDAVLHHRPMVNPRDVFAHHIAARTRDSAFADFADQFDVAFLAPMGAAGRAELPGHDRPHMFGGANLNTWAFFCPSCTRRPEISTEHLQRAVEDARRVGSTRVDLSCLEFALSHL